MGLLAYVATSSRKIEESRKKLDKAEWLYILNISFKTGKSERKSFSEINEDSHLIWSKHMKKRWLESNETF